MNGALLTATGEDLVTPRRRIDIDYAGRSTYEPQTLLTVVGMPYYVDPLELRVPSIPDWFGRVTQDVMALGELQDDWDSYGGGGIPDEHLVEALKAALLIGDLLPRPSVFPTASGGVLLEWESPESELTLNVHGTDDWSFYLESKQGDEPPLEGTIDDWEQLTEALQDA